MASPSSNGGGNNENTQGEGNKNTQSTNESGHSHDTKANYVVNNNAFGYQQQDPGAANGMRLNNTNTQWGNYDATKFTGQQHFGAMPGGGYGGQDEASFVQNFAVQQQPVFFGGYPYYGGFSPFANPLYSQLGYFGQPFVDPQSFMALNNGQQNLIGIPPPDGLTGNMAGERSADHQDGGIMSGGDLLMNMPGMENLYSLYQQQLGNAFANLSLQDVQDQQRLLQQQLYHQQLLQLQQQQLQQQLHQQLLLQSQLAAQVEAGDISTPSQDSQPTLGLISNTQQTSTEEETQQSNKQIEAKDVAHSEASEPKEQSEEGQQTHATSDEKQKHDGPRSWADVLAAKKNATSTNPTPTVSTTSTTNTNTTPTHASTNASTPVATLSPTSGAMVPVKPTHTHKSEDASRNKQPPLKIHDKYNPTHFDYNVTSARFFVIKSYSEDDIHKAIKYNIWASTDSGNRRLDAAFRESSSAGPIYLFFSVNASGQFCGMARMTTALDYGKKSDLWAQDKWNGQFGLHWIFIKDIPNAHLRHIRLMYLYYCWYFCALSFDLVRNNENKPVTNSRDTQEIFLEPGKEVLRIFTTYVSKTSILDDFSFYDKRQEIMKEKKQIEGDTGDEANKPETNSELPLATGESRKQRTYAPPPPAAAAAGKVASPPQGHQPYSTNANKSNSPQPYTKSLNGSSPKTAPTQQQRVGGGGSGSGSGSGAKKK